MIKEKGSQKAMMKLIGSPDFIQQLRKIINDNAIELSNDEVYLPSKQIQKEAQLKNFLGDNFSIDLKSQLQNWWIDERPKFSNTPNWDFISTCTINGVKGILLIEAKAHLDELKNERSGKRLGSKLSKKNHDKIGDAIKDTHSNLKITYPKICISRDKCYQLSNRIAHAWWLANQGIPVVLVYQGFLNCKDMDYGNRTLFNTDEEWQECFKNHTKLVGADELIGKWVDCGKSKFNLLCRSIEI